MLEKCCAVTKKASEMKSFKSTINSDKSSNKRRWEPSLIIEECFKSPRFDGWRKVPRSPSDFANLSSSSSSNESLHYNEWLKSYRSEEIRIANQIEVVNQETQTSPSLVLAENKNIPTLFPEVKDNVWSFTSPYWGTEECRRHWPLHKNQLEYLFFPSHYPHLNLPTRYGRYHFHWHVGAATPEIQYKKKLCQIISGIIHKLKIKNPQISKLILCDTLANISWFDALSRVMIIRNLAAFLRKQHHLELVCFENARLPHVEGVVLLCALSEHCGSVTKELHIWKMFAFGHSPVLMDELSIEGKRSNKKYPKEWTDVHFQEILNNFSTLTHLSINYAYLANRKGDALLQLKSVRNGQLKELRILCLEEERPIKTNPGYGNGGWTITDGVWFRVKEWCPTLHVKFVFVNMPNYENIILFLSKSIPMNHIFISSGMDLRFQSPWEIDSTLLELRNWYAGTLETLSLHLWHHRDMLDFVIKHKILYEFPNLETFEFIGKLTDLSTLDTFCNDLSTGNFKLKSLTFWVEEEYSEKEKRKCLKKDVFDIFKKYKNKFDNLCINADISIYPA